MKYYTNIDLNQNEILSPVIHKYAGNPNTGSVPGVDGQMLWDSVGKTLYSHNGTEWIAVGVTYIHPNHTGDVTSVGDGAQTIANSAVTNAKMANMAETTIKGRKTGSAGAPEDLTASEVRTLINVADGANAYVHPNHSGDVTSVADGATTITNKAVTLAKMADIATASILGRKTALPGTPEVLSKSDVLTLLNVADGANAYVHPNHSGDVTSTGDGATVIANNAVTLAKLATQASDSFLANVTTGVAVPSAVTVAEQTLVGRITGGHIDDLSATQVRTLLNVADGANAYTHPNHSGDVTSVGDGAITIVNGAVTLAKMANMATGSLIYRKTAGTGVPEVNTLATLKTDLAITKTDVGLGNVTNDAQVKKSASSTNGNVPVWNGTTGDALNNGYGVETTLTGSASNLARADAIKNYIDNLLGANDAMIFKGTVGVGGTFEIAAFNSLTTYGAGWAYKVTTAGTIKGKVCEVGDMIVATVDRAGSGNVDADWVVLQTNIDGAVTGPASAVTGNFASFDGTTGKIIQDSGSKASDFATSGHTHTNMTFKKTFDVGGSTTIVLTHNLGTRDVSVTLRRVASPYDVVYADVELTTIDTATIRFAVAPSAAEYRATIIG